MAFSRRVFSLVLILLGLVIGMYPLISVTRLSGQALNELSDVAGVEAAADTRHGIGALLDEDFIVAERRYEGVSGDALLASLRDDGYEGISAVGFGWTHRDCCGEYDAVLVSVQEIDGSTVARMTMADSDVQLSWLPLLLMGLALLGFGISLNVRPPKSDSGVGGDE